MLIDLHKLIQQNIAAGSEIVIAGPVALDKVRKAELMLGVEFPPSYKAFLTEYGAIEIDGRSFAGLTPSLEGGHGDVVAFTKYARESYGLPVRYIAIDFQDGDAFLCLDTEQKHGKDESSVVLVSPVDGKQQGPVTAESLPDYLMRYLSS
jgi:hypothetical protein